MGGFGGFDCSCSRASFQENHQYHAHRRRAFFVEAQVAAGKNKATSASKATPAIDNGRAGCNARFLLREVHVSGALSGAAPERGPRWQTHAQRRNTGNLHISLHATDQAFRSLMPSPARGVDGGPRRFTQVVPNEQFLPVAGRKRNVRAPRIGQQENPAAVRDSGLPLS